MHLDAVGDESGFELFEQLRQVFQRVAADRRAEVAQRGQVAGIGKLGQALGLQEVHGAAKTAAQGGVAGGGAGALGEAGGRLVVQSSAHDVAPSRHSSTITSRGPWAP